MKDAVKPNLVQTLENTAAFIHGGPFANIAHGANSVIATRLGLKLADYMITEAGFGADLGAEKFFDIVCRYGGFKPAAVVLVASIRALKSHGGVKKEQLAVSNVNALEKGSANLEKHLLNLKKFGVPVVVAVNEFPTDTKEEIEFLRDKCRGLHAEMAVSKVWEHGGAGGEELAHKIITASASENNFQMLYPSNMSLKDKISCISTEIYGAAKVEYAPAADKTLNLYQTQGYGDLPVCIAKTQYSLSDNPDLLGRPEGFTVNIREAGLSAGAGFVVALAGNIMTMPGLGAKPSAENIDILADGSITGLF
jgi:formate--tetrahydrofolate ligase